MKKIVTIIGSLFISLSGMAAETTHKQAAQKSFSVVKHSISYKFLEDQISYNLAAPISVVNVSHRVLQAHNNAGAYVTYALVGIGAKNYTVILQHDNGSVSICDMKIIESESESEDSLDSIEVGIENCDGFMKSYISEHGLHFTDGVDSNF